MVQVLLETFYDLSSKCGEKLLSLSDPVGQHQNSPTANWPLADFHSVALILLLYISLVVVGTLTLKPLKHNVFNLKPLQFIYNPIQIILCSYMCVEAAVVAYRNGYTFLPCNKFNVEKPVLANLVWLFYLSKILDLMDTVFIVFGQKWKQLSFLHVYHHISVLLVYWVLLRVGYDGEIYLSVVLNAFIHSVMYTYYFVSGHTKNIWWKKYLTGLQMIQFLTMNLQAIFMVKNKCEKFPDRIAWAYLFYAQSLFWLFLHFFVQAYLPKTKTLGSKKEN